MHYYQQNPYQMQQSPMHMKHMVLQAVEPVAQYGLKEAKYTSYAHAMREVAAISYLMGKGYSPQIAR